MKGSIEILGDIVGRASEEGDGEVLRDEILQGTEETGRGQSSDGAGVLAKIRKKNMRRKRAQ